MKMAGSREIEALRKCSQSHSHRKAGIGGIESGDARVRMGCLRFGSGILEPGRFRWFLGLRAKLLCSQVHLRMRLKRPAENKVEPLPGPPVQFENSNTPA